MHADLDLTGDPEGSEPTTAADLEVRRVVYRDSSTLTIKAELWKAHLQFHYSVQGPLSWAPPLCAIVLFTAVTAALAVPSLILPPDVHVGMQITVAAVSGGTVLLSGAAILLYWLHRH